MVTKIKPQEARVDFSFKREVFFIIAGGIIGALVMAIPFTFFSPEGISRAYDLTWVVFGHIVGIHSPISSAIIAGMTIHIVVGISIGIVSVQEQFFTINKHGISARIHSPTAIIASANPIGGEWKDPERIDLDEIPAIKPLIDRFDLIFVTSLIYVVE